MSWSSDISSISSALPATPTASPQIHSPLGSSDDWRARQTPPPSLQLYSSALKAKMAEGMAVAIQGLESGRRRGRYGNDEEEDPIERHVRLYLTPQTATRAQHPRRALCHLASDRSVSAPPTVTSHAVDVTLGGTSRKGDQHHEKLAASPSIPEPFVPGLLDFMPRRPDVWRVDSTSTVSSEASFEAINAEDMFRLYGVKRAQEFHEDSTATRPVKASRLTPTSIIHSLHDAANLPSPPASYRLPCRIDVVNRTDAEGKYGAPSRVDDPEGKARQIVLTVER
ncbi:uncharacterized protein L203_103743 [Cryptococcus depauperatus CBS 7841]|uniref:Uncharacterized protein n=1 Tax=Cryptococcus depauperatus CBS 7841 TaxID=1295531 RepID=A0A1E3IEY2_9TREE|nr:hypothetical protein L203_03759 [Cryptococcus depauperatus CBS 7841]